MFDSVTDYVVKIENLATSAEGAVTILRSKNHVFTEPSLISFYVRMWTDESDVQSRMGILLSSPLSTAVHRIFTVMQRDAKLWQKYYMCAPVGMYSLVFEAVKGTTHRPQIAVDTVQVFPGITDPSSLESSEGYFHWCDDGATGMFRTSLTTQHTYHF